VLAYPEYQEELHRFRYPSGFTVYVNRKPGRLRQYASLGVGFGSINVRYRPHGTSDQWREVPPGMAHFLEHKLFSEEGGDAFDRFAALGASANAETSFTTTSYFFDSAGRFDEALELLVGFVRKLHVTEANVEKEKPIIAQEIGMYDDDPGWIGYTRPLAALYCAHPIRNDIAGTVDDITQATPEMLRDLYRSSYTPDNAILSVSGDVDPDAVAECAGKLWGTPDGTARADDAPVDEAIGPAEARVELPFAVHKPRLYVGLKADLAYRGHGDEAALRAYRRGMESFLLEELLFRRGSPAFDRWYDSGLIDANFGSAHRSDRSFEYVVLSGDTHEPDRLADEVFGELRRFATANDDTDVAHALARKKRKAIGHFVRSLSSPAAVAGGAFSHHLAGTDLFALPEIIRGVSVADLRRYAAELAQEDRAARVIMVPDADAE
jgi:predicted Zn-dependent peptidase